MQHYCPVCGEIAPASFGHYWTCTCGAYIVYAEDKKTTNRWLRELRIITVHGVSMGGSAHKSKRYGQKKVSSGYEWRYRSIIDG
jgi:hypothetical protein